MSETRRLGEVPSPPRQNKPRQTAQGQPGNCLRAVPLVFSNRCLVNDENEDCRHHEEQRAQEVEVPEGTFLNVRKFFGHTKNRATPGIAPIGPLETLEVSGKFNFETSEMLR